jgi:hypothetical protein
MKLVIVPNFQRLKLLKDLLLHVNIHNVTKFYIQTFLKNMAKHISNPKLL